MKAFRKPIALLVALLMQSFLFAALQKPAPFEPSLTTH